MTSEQFSRAIIRLEHTEKAGLESPDEIEKYGVPNGTAFLISNEGKLFAVSARHVVEKEYDLHAKVQAKSKTTGEMRSFLLKLPKDGWAYHPGQGSRDTHYVDVAAIKIELLEDHDLLSFSFNPLAKEERDLSFDEAENPTAVLIFGFPEDSTLRLSGERPFGRLGIVPPAEKRYFLRVSNGKFLESKAYPVDAEIFQGDSGGPVFQPVPPLLLSKDMRIVGLVIGADIDMEYAVVEPAFRIRETLEFAKRRTVRGHRFWFKLTE
jgi:hypothetical protein